MSSSSRGSGPDRQGSRRRQVAGSRGRPQSRAQQPESQEPESQEPESPDTGDAETREPVSPESGSEPEAADVSPEAADADDDEAGASDTGAGSGSSADEPSAPQVAQLPPDEADARHEGAADSEAADPVTAGAGTAAAGAGAAGAGAAGAGADEDGSDEDGSAEDGSGEGGTAQRGRPGRRAAMLAAAAVLAGFGAWFAYETITLHTGGAAANEALVDAGATSEVNGQVSDAVTKLFSYNFAEQDKADAAANELLVGPAVDKYNELWGVLREQAPEQKLVVDTAVKSSAVTWLQGDRAEVLLYVDQKATRAGDQEGQNEPAQLTVGAEKDGDQWKVNRITLR